MSSLPIPPEAAWAALTAAVGALWRYIAATSKTVKTELQDCQKDRMKLWQVISMLAQHVDGIDVRDVLKFRNDETQRIDPPTPKAKPKPPARTSRRLRTDP